MNRFATIVNVTALFIAVLTSSTASAGIGDPFNGIDVSLIDKSTGSAVAYAGTVGPLVVTGLIDKSTGSAVAFQSTGITSLTPGLTEGQVGFRKEETYTATENLDIDLTVADPGTGVEFNASFSFTLPSDFSQELQLTSITNGGDTFNYDMEITQYDTQLPSILIGNLGTPGSNWTVALTFMESAANASLGTGVLDILAGGDETSAAIQLFRQMEVTVTNNASGPFTSMIQADAPQNVDVIPEPASIALVGLGSFVLIRRKMP
jgi:PEP-CTERM motif-containing protein